MTSSCAGASTTSSTAATTVTVEPTSTSTSSTSTTTTIPARPVRGTVRDHRGEPVARALIEVGVLQTTTGSDGWFYLEAQDPQQILVTKPGWTSAEMDWSEDTSSFDAVIEPRVVRGLRVGAEAAGDEVAFQALLDLAASTAVNAFVFDTKQEGGNVLYDTSVSDAHEIGAVEVFYDPSTRIAQAHDAGLYAITRLVTFEDGVRAEARPDEKLAGRWLDPFSPGAADYNLALAEEACGLGFDEVMFDYVRFPTGSAAGVSGQLDMSQDERVGAIASFLSRARELLHPMGCAVSAAIFGIVVSVPDDQGLGQRPEELSPHLDAVSPMVYPSHYSNGWLGFTDPNDHPYEVTADAITDALPRMDHGASLRPWLQGFWWTDAQIRRSIQAAEDHGVGWMIWNVRSNFSANALPTDDEVTG